MSQKISLLPENVANQIAAGEVVQRPASVVKELLENAIDSGATKISLHIREAGRSFIQVVDNGNGMNAEDLRLCIERHATSKIKLAEDLFEINSMGFRGEALASISSVAQVEIKSREKNEDIGNQLLVEGGKIKDLHPESCAKGTCVTVKNLFFNIPARRNFLKSNPVETRHIIEAFQRIALSFEDIDFKLFNQEEEVFTLARSSFRQRIIHIFGKRYNERLVPVEENTDIVSLTGHIGKPEFAKRSRGEQYFFVNNRFIKSAYLNHAVLRAYEELLPKELHPSYFIRLEINPNKIDINIHPTKTEIKFEDEKSIYAILRTTIKRALGKFNIAPSLDFERETTFDTPYSSPREVKVPQINVDPEYNPFKPSTVKVNQPSAHKEATDNWEKLFEDHLGAKQSATEENQQIIQSNWDDQEKIEVGQSFIQLREKYILTNVKSGLMIIDQERAHQRILYERNLSDLAGKGLGSQTLLHPEKITFNIQEMSLLKELQEPLEHCGILFSVEKENEIALTAIPETSKVGDSESLLRELMAQNEFEDIKIKHRIIYDNLAISLAKSEAIKAGKKMSNDEMKDLVDHLFACDSPTRLPNGSLILLQLDISEIANRFENP